VLAHVLGDEKTAGAIGGFDLAAIVTDIIDARLDVLGAVAGDSDEACEAFGPARMLAADNAGPQPTVVKSIGCKMALE